jgi:hypothetical protein
MPAAFTAGRQSDRGNSLLNLAFAASDLDAPDGDDAAMFVGCCKPADHSHPTNCNENSGHVRSNE